MHECDITLELYCMQANSFNIVYQLMHYQHSEFQNDTKLQAEEASWLERLCAIICTSSYAKLEPLRRVRPVHSYSIKQYLVPNNSLFADSLRINAVPLLLASFVTR